MGVWERPRQEFLDALDREFGIQAPRRSGCDTVESLHAMYERRAKVFFAISGNLLSAAPDTQYAAEALSRCRLTVQVSTKLNRGHLVTGQQALILPCLGRAERDLRDGSEQFATTEDTMGIINPSRGRERPASDDLLSEVAIVVCLARATFGDQGPVDWKSLLDNDRIRDHIARVIPGFEDFNARIQQGPFYLPNGAREREFHTPSGKAVFSVCTPQEPNLGPGELLMTTVRSHDQFNTTVYGLNDRYRGVYHGRRVIFVHPDDSRGARDRAGAVGRHHQPLQGGEARRSEVPGGRVPHRPPQRRDVLPGGERARSRRLGGGPQQPARAQVRAHHAPGLRGILMPSTRELTRGDAEALVRQPLYRQSTSALQTRRACPGSKAFRPSERFSEGP